MWLKPVPVTEYFRFTDLPAELRNKIYECMLEEPEDIKMSSHLPRDYPKRAVRDGFTHHHPGMELSKTTGKWKGNPPSNYAILRVSKQILQEAAPIAYGNNAFRFNDMSDLKLWLEGVGTMRKLIRHIKLVDGYMSTKYRAIYNKLKEAKDLRSLTFTHTTICRGEKSERGEVAPSKQRLVHHMKPLLTALHKLQKAGERQADVLDLIRINGTKRRCWQCQKDSDPSPECVGCGSCHVLCKDFETHNETLTADIRELVAKQLGIKE